MAYKREIVRSHKKRMALAKRQARRGPIKEDCKALINYYLLQDLVELYEYLYDEELSIEGGDTDIGQDAHEHNLECLENCIVLFKSAEEVCGAQIRIRRYKIVRSSIKERALMRAANKEDYGKMVNLAYNLIVDIYNKTLLASDAKEELENKHGKAKKADGYTREMRKHSMHKNQIPTKDDVKIVVGAVKDINDGKIGKKVKGVNSTMSGVANKKSSSRRNSNLN